MKSDISNSSCKCPDAESLITLRHELQSRQNLIVRISVGIFCVKTEEIKLKLVKHNLKDMLEDSRWINT